MHIRIALANVHPCTKFGVPRSKGVRAKGQKAGKIKLPPGGTILTPRGWLSQWYTIHTKALLTWKFGLPATSRLGCSPETTFFEGFTRRHVAHATWNVTPRDRHHRRSAVPGASNEPSPIRIGPAVPALFTKPVPPLATFTPESYNLLSTAIGR